MEELKAGEGHPYALSRLLGDEGHVALKVGADLLRGPTIVVEVKSCAAYQSNDFPLGYMLSHWHRKKISLCLCVNGGYIINMFGTILLYRINERKKQRGLCVAACMEEQAQVKSK